MSQLMTDPPEGGWETMAPAEGDRMFGVFERDGVAPKPKALFSSQDDAETWIALQTDGPERFVWMETRHIRGLVWNREDPPPDSADEPLYGDVSRWEFASGWKDEVTFV